MKEALYDVHGQDCPSDCCLKMSLEDLREDLELSDDAIRTIEKLKKGDVYRHFGLSISIN